MKKRIVFIVYFIFLLAPTNVLAHPGRTDSSGGHTCKTNCPDWGLEYGEYHYHSGNTYRNSKGQVFNSDGTLISNGETSSSNNNPNTSSNSSSTTNNNSTSNSNATSNNTNSNNSTANSNKNTNSNATNSNDNKNNTPKVPAKSSDNTLKSIMIDGDEIKIADEMSYSTFNKTAKISVETNDGKASYDIQKDTFQVGDNKVVIKVIAENGSSKTYNLLVNVEEKLSNNANIKLIVDETKVDFMKGKATVSVSSNVEKLDYRYILEDENAEIEIIGDDKLKDGNNIMIFKVTAQDGTEKNYELTIHKIAKTNETIGAIIGFGIMGGMGYGGYRIVKKIKRK